MFEVEVDTQEHLASVWFINSYRLYMALLLGIAKAPRCLSCLRSSVGAEVPLLTNPFMVQVRGKKKKAKLPPTIPVRLLRNVTGYGSKGKKLEFIFLIKF